MTLEDVREFTDALNRLGRVMGRTVSEELAEDYAADLREFPIDVVKRAIERVRKTSRYWPRPAAIVEACVALQVADLVSAGLTGAMPEHGDYACSFCWDSGFERGLECPGDGSCHIAGCGQPGRDNHPHHFTRRCACRGTNPVLARQRQLVQLRTQAPDRAW